MVGYQWVQNRRVVVVLSGEEDKLQDVSNYLCMWEGQVAGKRAALPGDELTFTCETARKPVTFNPVTFAGDSGVSQVETLIHSLTYFLAYLLSCSLTFLPTYSLNHLLTYLLTYSLTDLLTRDFA